MNTLRKIRESAQYIVTCMIEVNDVELVTYETEFPTGNVYIEFSDGTIVEVSRNEKTLQNER